MRNIAKAQYGISRKDRRRVLRQTRCISPFQPGCARRAEKKAIREMKRTGRKDEREANREARRQKRQTPPPTQAPKKGTTDYPKIVKRNYLTEEQERGMPGRPMRIERSKRPGFIENVSKTDWSSTGRYGLKAPKKVTKAQTGVKKKTATIKAKHGSGVTKRGSKK